MDHQTFDRLTRLVGTAASRRTAWRGILGAALFGGTTRSAVAQQCPDSKHRCGADCCPGKCFTGERSCKVCCTEKNNNIICPTAGGNAVCCPNNGNDPCAGVQDNGACPQNAAPNGGLCQSGIAGSYRRRR